MADVSKSAMTDIKDGYLEVTVGSVESYRLNVCPSVTQRGHDGTEDSTIFVRI